MVKQPIRSKDATKPCRKLIIRICSKKSLKATCLAPRRFQPIGRTRTRCGRDSTRSLAEARAADAVPWGQARLSLYRSIVPQMTVFLPDEEGAQLRFEFEQELERLKAA